MGSGKVEYALGSSRREEAVPGTSKGSNSKVVVVEKAARDHRIRYGRFVRGDAVCVLEQSGVM